MHYRNDLDFPALHAVYDTIGKMRQFAFADIGLDETINQRMAMDMAKRVLQGVQKTPFQSRLFLSIKCCRRVRFTQCLAVPA